jgi:hypothetical protein
VNGGLPFHHMRKLHDAVTVTVQSPTFCRPYGVLFACQGSLMGMPARIYRCQQKASTVSLLFLSTDVYSAATDRLPTSGRSASILMVITMYRVQV